MIKCRRATHGMNSWLTCRCAAPASGPASELTSSWTRVGNRRRSAQEGHVQLTCRRAEPESVKVPRHIDTDFLNTTHTVTINILVLNLLTYSLKSVTFHQYRHLNSLATKFPPPPMPSFVWAKLGLCINLLLPPLTPSAQTSPRPLPLIPVLFLFGFCLTV